MRKKQDENLISPFLRSDATDSALPCNPIIFAFDRRKYASAVCESRKASIAAVSSDPAYNAIYARSKIIVAPRLLGKIRILPINLYPPNLLS